MIKNEDTITAIATPNGTGAIAIIRISGDKSFENADKIFTGRIKICEAKTHTIHYGKILGKDKELIDDVMISVFIAPHSYTGEDSVEISAHGNPFVAKKIIELLVENGVRLAEPGEFTKRAFLNGKLDLSQAEAVVDVINSSADAALRGARNQLDGLLSKKVTELRTLLVNTSSLVELELDFAEEDIEFVDRKELISRIEKIISEISLLLKSYEFGKIIRDGVNVALVGKPNVGKSSLLNYLLKESRAIVSEIPGTTRDIIREEVTIGGILFRLFDTAGIRPSDDAIEKEGITRSKEAIKNSDLVIFLNDVENGVSQGMYNQLCELTEPKKIITVLNKVDLSKNPGIGADVYISAKTGYGINNLLEELKEKSFGDSTYSEKSAIVSNVRHFDCLRKAKENLLKAKQSAEQSLSGEFVSVDLRNAESVLGEIIGEVTSEDILNNIFSKFCIGK
jgi:tRNA modification GTPase